jgi:hypothetical protein
MKIELLSVPDCPNVSRVRALLHACRCSLTGLTERKQPADHGHKIESHDIESVEHPGVVAHCAARRVRR